MLTMFIKANCVVTAKKITLVSSNASDKKNLHPGGCKLFFDQFN